MKNMKKAPVETPEKHKKASDYQAAKISRPKMETEKHPVDKKPRK